VRTARSRQGSHQEFPRAISTEEMEIFLLALQITNYIEQIALFSKDLMVQNHSLFDCF